MKIEVLPLKARRPVRRQVDECEIEVSPHCLQLRNALKQFACKVVFRARLRIGVQRFWHNYLHALIG